MVICFLATWLIYFSLGSCGWLKFALRAGKFGFRGLFDLAGHSGMPQFLLPWLIASNIHIHSFSWMYSFVSVGLRCTSKTVLQWISQEYSPEGRGGIGFGESLERAKKVETRERLGSLWVNNGPWPRTRLLPHSLGWGMVLPWRLREGQVLWSSYFEVGDVKHCPNTLPLYSGTRSQVAGGNLPWRMPLSWRF